MTKVRVDRLFSEQGGSDSDRTIQNVSVALTAESGRYLFFIPNQQRRQEIDLPKCYTTNSQKSTNWIH
jgi:hypothetical protein